MRVQCSSLAFWKKHLWKYVFFSDILILPFYCSHSHGKYFCAIQQSCVVAWSCLHPGESAACGRGILQAFEYLALASNTLPFGGEEKSTRINKSEVTSCLRPFSLEVSCKKVKTVLYPSLIVTQVSWLQNSNTLRLHQLSTHVVGQLCQVQQLQLAEEKQENTTLEFWNLVLVRSVAKIINDPSTPFWVQSQSRHLMLPGPSSANQSREKMI